MLDYHPFVFAASWGPGLRIGELGEVCVDRAAQRGVREMCNEHVEDS